MSVGFEPQYDFPYASTKNVEKMNENRGKLAKKSEKISNLETANGCKLPMGRRSEGPGCALVCSIILMEQHWDAFILSNFHIFAEIDIRIYEVTTRCLYELKCRDGLA
jgi:hypothetical protein